MGTLSWTESFEVIANNSLCRLCYIIYCLIVERNLIQIVNKVKMSALKKL